MTRVIYQLPVITDDQMKLLSEISRYPNLEPSAVKPLVDTFFIMNPGLTYLLKSDVRVNRNHLDRLLALKLVEVYGGDADNSAKWLSGSISSIPYGAILMTNRGRMMIDSKFKTTHILLIDPDKTDSADSLFDVPTTPITNDLVISGLEENRSDGHWYFFVRTTLPWVYGVLSKLDYVYLLKYDTSGRGATPAVLQLRTCVGYYPEEAYKRCTTLLYTEHEIRRQLDDQGINDVWNKRD